MSDGISSLPAGRLPEGTFKWVPWLFLLGGVAFCPLAIYLFGPLGIAASVAIAGTLVALFTHPLVVFAVYFGLLFFKETIIPGLPVSLNRVAAPMFFLSTLVYAIRGKTLPLRFNLLPLLSAVVLYFVISGLTSEHFENGVLYARYAVVYLILAVCVALVLTSERTVYAFSWIIVLLTSAAAVHGLYEAMDKNLLNVVGNFWGSSKRVSGTAANSVVFGWNLLYAFPFAFFLFAQMKSASARLLALGLGMLILAVATFTFNRQTYVMMAAIVGLCALLYTYRNRVIFLGVIAVMGGVGAFTVLPLVLRRMLTVTELTRDYSFLERSDSYKMAFEMIRENPLTGVGFGAYSKVWWNYIPADYSTYFAQYKGPVIPKAMDMGMMSILAETGFIGFFLFVGWMLVLGIFVWRRRREAIRAEDRFAKNLATTVLVVQVFFVMSAFIQDNFLYTRIWVLYGVAFVLDPRHLEIVPGWVGRGDVGTDEVDPAVS